MPSGGETIQVALVADSGSAAADGGCFYRSPEYLAAEGVTHTLVLGEGGPALPVIVREIPGGGRDAISPYGYPGAADSALAPVEPEQLDWSDCGLVSVFVRDRVGEPRCLADGTERGAVVLSDPNQPPGMRKRLREQVRSAERDGWSVRSVPGPQVSDTDLDAFHVAYSQTMARAKAADRYLYERDYLRALLSSPTATLLLADSPEGESAAGAIMVSADGLLHYHLGGTLDAALDASPMKLLFAAMIDASSERGMVLNLGGGLEQGDSLERFKSGFGNAGATFVTHEIVCDRQAYDRLVEAAVAEGREAPGGFFPAYRA